MTWAFPRGHYAIVTLNTAANNFVMINDADRYPFCCLVTGAAYIGAGDVIGGFACGGNAIVTIYAAFASNYGVIKYNNNPGVGCMASVTFLRGRDMVGAFPPGNQTIVTA